MQVHHTHIVHGVDHVDYIEYPYAIYLYKHHFQFIQCCLQTYAAPWQQRL